ncbi:MAG: flagellar basal body L-ring protein FlgH [Planctomycetota bacterium]
MNRILTGCILAACGSLMLAGSCEAQSLFERRSRNQIEQYRDYAARQRGDLLSITINENTDVQNRDERSLDKTGLSSYNGAFNYGFGGDIGSSTGDTSLGHTTQSARGFSGDTEFRTQRRFLDSFTVTVTDVLPNGNLVVSGTRKINLQGDSRELRLSGIVRQYDILPNNTVSSHLVANLKIQMEAEGTEQAFNNQGWFSKNIVNRFWPF